MTDYRVSIFPPNTHAQEVLAWLARNPAAEDPPAGPG
jgi:hypothetical protein